MQVATPKRVMIVGFGLLGSAIAAAAVDRNIDARVLTRSRPARAACRGLVVGDAAEPGTVLRLGSDVEHIFYAAGSSVPAAVEIDPVADLALSLAPVRHTIDACSRLRCGLTLLSSGGTIYGNVDTLPIPEHQPTDPISYYGIRNLVVEKYASVQAHRLGLKIRILRISNAFGIYQPVRRSQGIIATLLHNMAHDKPVTVHGDGLLTRDYIHVDDVASAALQLLDAPSQPEIVNVGTGRGVSILELVSICNSITGKKARIRFDDPRPLDVNRNVLDIALLQRLIEFQPTMLEFAIRQIWNQLMVSKADRSQK